MSISQLSRVLAQADLAVASAPDVREDRVRALKAAIASGTYTVDSRQLASKMLQSLNL